MATLADGSTLREDVPPWCDWHAALDVPWHASRCLSGRAVMALAWVGEPESVVSIPDGAEAVIERRWRHNLRTGERWLHSERLGWR
ncbi:MAG: hypothetical protein PHQ28_12850 [Mycobacterium sp.]|nr:hypothetical protein [Mycobacterium sp.]